MTLARLTQRGGLTGSMTATPATLATQESSEPKTVAAVATVAVAKHPEPPTELSLEEEADIRAWLAHVEETDPAIVTEVVDMCRADMDARRYFLKWSEEISESSD